MDDDGRMGLENDERSLPLCAYVGENKGVQVGDYE